MSEFDIEISSAHLQFYLETCAHPTYQTAIARFPSSHRACSSNYWGSPKGNVERNHVKSLYIGISNHAECNFLRLAFESRQRLLEH